MLTFGLIFATLFDIMNRKVRKSPSVVPIRDSVQISSTAFSGGRGQAYGPTPSGRSKSRSVPVFELHQTEDDFQSHQVRKYLEKHQIHFVSMKGTKKNPVLVDRVSGARWEGVDSITQYLQNRAARGHESKKRNSARRGANLNEFLVAVTRAIDNRRDEVRWRILAPFDDFRLLGLDWRRALKTTVQSGKDLVNVTQTLIKEIRSDLSQADPVVLAGSSSVNPTKDEVSVVNKNAA
jgi:hypothetical protein